MADSSQEPQSSQSGPLLIVGLGNPGDQYAETRHNAGFWFLDALVGNAGVGLRLQQKLHAETAKVNVHGRNCILARPTTFMNHSGRAVQAVSAYYRVSASDILVAYDELDLPPGTARFKFSGGHGGHNGIRDTVQSLGTADFHRLRIGIGHPGFKDAVTPWVLSRPGRDQEQLIRSAIDKALDALPDFVDGRVNDAMKRLHTDDKGTAEAD
ncbi:MAG: aminoacyl-tRNA hydrolase [Xanthomonadales bacterium]|nr:aminoacyl-tRNA hydrolase [Xanthomonadales bacterium]